jgi:hypothetical protein
MISYNNYNDLTAELTTKIDLNIPETELLNTFIKIPLIKQIFKLKSFFIHF